MVVANMIALPLGWMLMNDWLKKFAYHIEIGLMPALVTLFLSLGVAILTVTYHALRAALADPVKSLRYE